jgi:hypothetical protein
MQPGSGRGIALKNAKVSYGKYKCKICGGLFGPREVALDHIDPVIDPEHGFIDWNTYIDRLFVAPEKYQVLCKAACHKLKTAEENKIRKEVKDVRKNKNISNSN